MKILTMAFGLSLMLLSFRAEARERVLIDQALNQSLKESQSVKKDVQKRKVQRQVTAARRSPKAINIEVGDAGLAQPISSGGKEEGLAWRQPDSVNTEPGNLDAEVLKVNAVKIEITPEERGEADPTRAVTNSSY